MKNLHRFGVVGIVVSLVAGVSLFAQEETSRARVVRLSFVEGTVTIQRPDVAEWSTAPVNTPIQEGFKLSTAADSYAEVEFENGSAVRLGESGIIEFTQLGLASSGAKLNRMTLDQGYASFSMRSGSDDVNEITAGDATITLPASSQARFRTDLDNGALRVEVFKGSVSVASPEGSQDLADDAILEIQPGAETPIAVNKGITKDAWDKWVDERESVLTASMNHPAPGLSPSDVNSTMYGWNDLNSYGNWAYIPGYGYGWYPAAGAGFIPYSSGRWVFYPGLGWTWISYEPWGWLPYHFGQWVYYPGIGWVWIPDDFEGFFGADVVWFEGPGWYGWCPATVFVPPVTAGGGAGGRIIHGPKGPRPVCPASACGVIVDKGVVVRGQPVSPRNIIGSNVFSGNPIRASALPSEPPVLLPGSPVAGGAARGAGRAPTTGQPGGSSGIVFDPAAGRYVNENGGTSRPAAPEPRARRDEPTSGGRGTGPAVWTRPAPVEPAAPQRSVHGGGGAERGSFAGGESGHSSSSGGGHSFFGGHSEGSGGGSHGGSGGHGFSGGGGGGGSHGGGGGGSSGGGGSHASSGGGGGASGGGGHSSGGSSSGGTHH